MPSAAYGRVLSSSESGSSLTRRISFRRDPLRTTRVAGSSGHAITCCTPRSMSSGLISLPERSPSANTSRSPAWGSALLSGEGSSARAAESVTPVAIAIWRKARREQEHSPARVSSGALTALAPVTVVVSDTARHRRTAMCVDHRPPPVALTSARCANRLILRATPAAKAPPPGTDRAAMLALP